MNLLKNEDKEEEISVEIEDKSGSALIRSYNWLAILKSIVLVNINEHKLKINKQKNEASLRGIWNRFIIKTTGLSIISDIINAIINGAVRGKMNFINPAKSSKHTMCFTKKLKKVLVEYFIDNHSFGYLIWNICMCIAQNDGYK